MSKQRIVRQNLPVDPLLGVDLQEYREQDSKSYWHCHPEVELIYIMSGGGSRWVGDATGAFHAGELYLVGAETPHCWSYDHTQGEQAGFYIHFSPEIFGDGFFDASGAKAVGALLARARRGLEVGVGARHRVLDEMYRLRAAVASRNLDGSLRGEALGRLFLILSLLSTSPDVVALSTCADDQPDGATTPVLARVMAYIQENAASGLRQKQAAKLAAMSPTSFSRFFQEHTGKPFRSYVAELRVGNACKLLRDSDRPITDVAFAVGFTNIANFNRLFLRLKGVTPRAYRKRARHVTTTS